MKGVELLASLLALLMMVGISAFLAGILIFVINGEKQPSTTPINYEMYYSPIYPPIKYEIALMSYLETNISNYKIKKILAFAAYQRNATNIIVDGNVEITNLGDFSSKIFDQWLPNEPYLLILSASGREYVLVEKRKSIQVSDTLKIRRISIPLYIDSSSIIVTDKTRELPLNITLDLYVQ